MFELRKWHTSKKARSFLQNGSTPAMTDSITETDERRFATEGSTERPRAERPALDLSSPYFLLLLKRPSFIRSSATSAVRTKVPGVVAYVEFVFLRFEQSNHPLVPFIEWFEQGPKRFDLMNYPQKRFDQVQFDVLSFDLPTPRRFCFQNNASFCFDNRETTLTLN